MHYLQANIAFQSTLPARGATIPSSADHMALDKFQSTLPARGATRPPIALCRPCVISIHAPRTGSDTRLACRSRHELSISIHAPRTGSDSLVRPLPSLRRHFNPRSPHGERLDNWLRGNALKDFNPRSPHGERQEQTTSDDKKVLISIHAPRTGSDMDKSGC